MRMAQFRHGPGGSSARLCRPLNRRPRIFSRMSSHFTRSMPATWRNMQKLLTEGTKVQITKFGHDSIKVYPTHRTAAAPQYVYDNTAKNVTTATFDPRGGRFGFTGAYGGVPFPIIDTSDAQVAGAQLIWNHLTAWVGYSDITMFTPGCCRDRRQSDPCRRYVWPARFIRITIRTAH